MKVRYWGQGSRKLRALQLLVVGMVSSLSLQSCHWWWDYYYGGWGYSYGHWYPWYLGYPPGSWYAGWYPGGPYRTGGIPHSLIEDPTSTLIVVPEDSAVQLSQDFGITVMAAQRVLQIANAKDKGKVLKSMGVTQKELESVSTYEMPSWETIEKIAIRLDEDPVKIYNLVSGLLADVRAHTEHRY